MDPSRPRLSSRELGQRGFAIVESAHWPWLVGRRESAQSSLLSPECDSASRALALADVVLSLRPPSARRHRHGGLGTSADESRGRSRHRRGACLGALGLHDIGVHRRPAPRRRGVHSLVRGRISRTRARHSARRSGAGLVGLRCLGGGPAWSLFHDRRGLLSVSSIGVRIKRGHRRLNPCRSANRNIHHPRAARLGPALRDRCLLRGRARRRHRRRGSRPRPAIGAVHRAHHAARTRHRRSRLLSPVAHGRDDRARRDGRSLHRLRRRAMGRRTWSRRSRSALRLLPWRQRRGACIAGVRPRAQAGRNPRHHRRGCAADLIRSPHARARHDSHPDSAPGVHARASEIPLDLLRVHLAARRTGDHAPAGRENALVVACPRRHRRAGGARAGGFAVPTPACGTSPDQRPSRARLRAGRDIRDLAGRSGQAPAPSPQPSPHADAGRG